MRIYHYLIIVIFIFIWGCKEDPPVEPDTSIAPEVKIVWPPNGSNVLDTTYLTIDATDDKGVTKIEIFIDNINYEALTMTIKPYRAIINAEYYDPSTPHTIIAKAYDGDQNVTSSEEISINTFQFQPTNLIATLTSDTSVTLRWRDNSNVESGFEIEQKTQSGNWAHLTFADSNITTLAVPGIYLTSEVYSFRIRSFNSNTTSTYSDIDTAKLVVPVPNNIKLKSQTSHSILLSWNDNCNFETGYQIERSLNNQPFIEIGETGISQSTFIVSGLDTAFTYKYRVRTKTSHNVSVYSEVINSDFLLSGVFRKFLLAHTGTLRSGVITHDDQFAITSADDKTIKIFSTETGSLVRSIDAHDLTIYKLALSPDGNTIASASDDKKIKLWRI